METINGTTTFKVTKDLENPVRGMLRLICEAMAEKGYDPVNQLVGYITSGDPTYITSHLGARKIISRIEKDEILEEIVALYVADISGKN